jgi:hypothetical protein
MIKELQILNGRKIVKKRYRFRLCFFWYRLRGSIEYYHRTTDGLIFNVPVPVSSGLDSKVQNIGSMFNGIEVSRH